MSLNGTISHPSGNDFRTSVHSPEHVCKTIQGRLFGRQATAEQTTALETLAAQARVATVPTQLSDQYGDGQKVEEY